MTGGHGHVTPRPDGAIAKCGGPAICSVCAAEMAQYDASKLRMADMIAPAVSDAQELADHMALVAKVAMAARSANADQATKVACDAVEASARRLMGLGE